MIASITTAVPAAVDRAATEAPGTAQFNAYEQAWQQASPEAQAQAHGSPAALGNDAMAWLTRFQANWHSFSTDLQAADASTATPPAQAASGGSPTGASTTGAATRPAQPSASSLHLVMETFDFAVQEHLVTQAATQLTGSVNTLVKQQ